MITAYNGPLDVVHTTKKHDLGAMLEVGGNVYHYCQGVASGVKGAWVTIDEKHATTLLAANAIGKVGIMMAALVANTYGWVQVYGVNTVASTDTIAANKQLYIDATAGRADDAVVVGDMILGATSQTADASNVATVYLNYPFVTDALG